MKETIVLLSLICSLCGYSQTKKDFGVAKKVASTSNPLPAPVNPVTPVSFTTVEECEEMIIAIDARIASVRSDKEKNAEAASNGWYDRMSVVRKKYSDKKAELQKSSR